MACVCAAGMSSTGHVRSLHDAIGDRPESETCEAHRLMGAEHNEIRGVSSCVQQNHARERRHVERGPSPGRSGLRRVHAAPPGPTPVPRLANCRPVLGHRVHEDELCAATCAHGKSLLKGCRGRSRCINCAQNPKRVLHCIAPSKRREALMMVRIAAPVMTSAIETPEEGPTNRELFQTS